MSSGWIQCLFHPSNKSTANLFVERLQVNVPQGQTVATVIANTVVLCILTRSTLGRREVCWIYLGMHRVAQKTLLASNISRSKSGTFEDFVFVQRDM